jgi:hypothetical protein
MPNISDTSVSDMSLSPAWSVMIIFLLMDSWFRDRLLAPRVSAANWVKAPGRSRKRLDGPLEQSQTGDCQKA